VSDRFVPAIVPFLAVALGLPSCGSDPGASANKTPPATHTVTIEAVSYTPDVLAVNVGDSIVWINKDPFPHTATSQDGGFDSKAMAAGGSWTYRAERQGDFTYTCTFHPTMKGTVRVK
jgi:plastocyanin